MTALAKIEANRTNGRLSKGPKTAKGKSVAKMNAVSHGLRSFSPVLPGEEPEDWGSHRAGVVAALAPVGALEVELAERVALLMWRLRRVVRYETAVVAAELASEVGRAGGRAYATVRKELEGARANAASFAETRDQLRHLLTLPDDHPFDGSDAFRLLRELTAYTPDGDEMFFDIEDYSFLVEAGVPEEWENDAQWWDGWTVGVVRAGAKVIAKESKMSADDLMEQAIRGSDQVARAEHNKAVKLEAELAGLSEATAEAERVACGRALLPLAPVVDKVVRYESHLNKQLTQTLHQLERWQAIRAGNPPVPPAALDVTVEAGAEAPPAGRDAKRLGSVGGP